MKKPILFLAMILAGATWGAAKDQSRDPYTEPVDTATVDTSGWAALSGPTRLTWTPGDKHYRQFATPEVTQCSDTIVNAWRGERLGLEALLISPEGCGPVKVSLSPLQRAGKTVAAPGSQASLMRYVITTAYNTCGYPSADLPTYTVPDMIDLPGTDAAIPAKSVRPVWVTVEVPRDIAPGDYAMTLTASAASTGKTVATARLQVNVAPNTLPAPKDYAFYLDMWQQPYAISRYYGVEPWSDAHLEKMAPYADMLARAGQKAVSVILFYEPWGEQSNDKFEPMVETVRTKDGKWKFDYTVLDRYVKFMADHGVDEVLECFTMVPWQPQYRYRDAATDSLKFIECKPGSPEYKELWTALLKDLTSHLKQKGWYEKTEIVMDERGLPDMLAALNVAQTAVPGLKMALAGNYHKELVDTLQSYTMIKGEFFPETVLNKRRAKGQRSILYTCCATPAPSQFSNSAPADGAYLPVYATATGFDGYLHWSFNNWTDHPMTDTRFHMFAPGDTYFVYPDGRTSVRYERMVEGIQMSEKIRLLRQELENRQDLAGLQLLEQALLPIRTGAMTSYYPTSAVVSDLHKSLDVISRRVAQ